MKNTRSRTIINSARAPKKQQGAVLAIGLMILLVMTLSAISGMESTILTERMAANAETISETFQSAESCLQASRASTGWHTEAITEADRDVDDHTWPAYGVSFSQIATTNTATIRAFKTKLVGGEVTTDAASYTTRLEITCTSRHPDFTNQVVTLVQGYKKDGAG